MSNSSAAATSFTWETLEGDGAHPETERAPVPGGWLYRTTTWLKVLDDPRPPTWVVNAQQVTFVPGHGFAGKGP